jgi:hypothetical protein
MQPDGGTNPNSSETSSGGAFYHFVFTVTTAQMLPKWVLDSGATCCATFSEVDCVDVRDCNVNVTAAGSSFTVHRIGTALINTCDEHGQVVQLCMRNTLLLQRL